MGSSASRPHAAVISYDNACRRISKQGCDLLRERFLDLAVLSVELKNAAPASAFSMRSKKPATDVSIEGGATISKEAFRRYLSPFFKGGKLTGRIMERIFEVADTTGSGELCFKDFFSTMVLFGIGDDRERLLFVFKMYDIEALGMISPKYFGLMVTQILCSSEEEVLWLDASGGTKAVTTGLVLAFGLGRSDSMYAHHLALQPRSQSAINCMTEQRRWPPQLPRSRQRGTRQRERDTTREVTTMQAMATGGVGEILGAERDESSPHLCHSAWDLSMTDPGN